MTRLEFKEMCVQCHKKYAITKKARADQKKMEKELLEELRAINNIFYDLQVRFQ